MLPKIWKKLLLAICIIACLFNVMSKIVNRISIEKMIATQQEGVNIKELLNITDENPVVTNTNTISTYDDTAVNNTVIQNQDEEEYDNNMEDEEQYVEEGEEEIPEEVQEDENEENSNWMDRLFNTNDYSNLLN